MVCAWKGAAHSEGSGWLREHSRLDLGGFDLTFGLFALVAELEAFQALTELYCDLLAQDVYNSAHSSELSWAGPGIRSSDPRWRRRCQALELLVLQAQMGRRNVTLGSLCSQGSPATTRSGKRITLYHQKMVLGKRRGESILNIVGPLTGTAWRLVEDYDVSKAEDESSFADLLKLLNGHFQYDDRVQLPTDFDGYFGLSQKPNQTLLSFISDHDEYHRKLEKHSVSLPESVQGWHLLRKACLTKEQRQLVHHHRGRSGSRQRWHRRTLHHPSPRSQLQCSTHSTRSTYPATSEAS